MTSERDVLAVLDRANPVPDPDALTVEPDASRYLAELVNSGAMRGHGHKSSHPQRWIAPVLAAAAVAMLLLGLIAVSGGDANPPAPADTIPTPATTTPGDLDDTRDTIPSDASASDPVPASMEWAFGHWIFRVQPDLWPALFGNTNSPQEATEQHRLRTQWWERFDEECSDIPHVDVAEPCGTPVPAPPIPSENFADLDRRLEEAGWTEINEGWGYEGCGSPFSGYLHHYQDDAVFWGGLERERFGATRMHGEIPLFRLSPAQAEIIGDQIVDLINCDDPSTRFPNAAEPVQIQELPASIPARGVIVGDSYAIFAVTTPRGGLAWIDLSGTVTLDTVNELATIISVFLDEVIE